MRVAAREELAPGLVHLFLDGEDPSYTRAGQYVIASVGEGKPAFFAIASPPGRPLELLVQANEGMAGRVAALLPGESLELSEAKGPGFALERAEGRRVLLFATGTGISPLRAVIESRPRWEGVLYYGARTLPRLSWAERFEDWSARGIEVIPVLSQPPEEWTGRRGWVQHAFDAHAPGDLGEAAALLAGLRGMLDEVKARLIAGGMPAERVLTNF